MDIDTLVQKLVSAGTSLRKDVEQASGTMPASGWQPETDMAFLDFYYGISDRPSTWQRSRGYPKSFWKRVQQKPNDQYEFNFPPKLESQYYASKGQIHRMVGSQGIRPAHNTLKPIIREIFQLYCDRGMSAYNSLLCEVVRVVIYHRAGFHTEPPDEPASDKPFLNMLDQIICAGAYPVGFVDDDPANDIMVYMPDGQEKQ